MLSNFFFPKHTYFYIGESYDHDDVIILQTSLKSLGNMFSVEIICIMYKQNVTEIEMCKEFYVTLLSAVERN